MGKRDTRRPLTAAAIERAEMALERIIGAPDYKELNYPTRLSIEGGLAALHNLWSFYRYEGGAR